VRRVASFKRALNARLARATGHRIVSATQPPAPPPRRRKRKLPRHYDPQARRIIRAVRPRTMTAHEKLFALIIATRHVADHGIPGAMVECGVWRGGSMQAIAMTLLDREVRDRDLHLYDTFEGMPPPTERDRRHDGRSAAEVLETTPRDGVYWAVAGLEDVRAGMAETGYPPERVHFHPGRVEQTIPVQAPERVALLRLDTDWYQSTRHELEHLYDRVPSGGVIVFDDYGFWDFSAKLFKLRGLLLHLHIEEPRFQDFHRLRTILVLRSLVLTRHHNARRQVRDANRRIGDVDVLAASAARSIGIDAQVFLVDVHVHILRQFGPDEDRGERGVSPLVLVER
jgi:hypothetical protein